MGQPARAPRALYCTDTFPPQLNGVSVVTALSVAGLRARGWDVSVIAPRYPAASPGGPAPLTMPQGGPGEQHTVASVPLPFYPDLRLSFPRAAAVGEVLDRFRPDIVHCATEFVIGRVGQAAAIARGIPVVSSYHTDFSRYAAEYGFPMLREPVRRYLARFHRRARRTYTPGHPARQELLALQVEDVEVWGRGVDAELFHPRHRDEALRRSFGPEHAFVLLYVGRLAAEKSVERVIEAFVSARHAVPSTVALRLVIAGTGPREAALKSLAPEGVTFLGNLDREVELPRLYASADAFVFASQTETLGLVVLEAMASGLPAVAVLAGGVADHLRDGINGIGCVPGDTEAMCRAIVALASDPARHRALAAGARRTAEALSWDQELDRLDQSYRSVCNGGLGQAWQATGPRPPSTRPATGSPSTSFRP